MKIYITPHFPRNSSLHNSSFNYGSVFPPARPLRLNTDILWPESAAVLVFSETLKWSTIHCITFLLLDMRGQPANPEDVGGDN